MSHIGGLPAAFVALGLKPLFCTGLSIFSIALSIAFSISSSIASTVVLSAIAGGAPSALAAEERPAAGAAAEKQDSGGSKSSDSRSFDSRSFDSRSFDSQSSDRERQERLDQSTGENSEQPLPKQSSSRRDSELRAIHRSWIKAIRGQRGGQEDSQESSQENSQKGEQKDGQKANLGTASPSSLRLANPGGKSESNLPNSSAEAKAAERQRESGRKGGDERGQPSNSTNRSIDAGQDNRFTDVDPANRSINAGTDAIAEERSEAGETSPSSSFLFAEEDSGFFSVLWRFGSMMALLLLGFYLLLRYIRSKMGGSFVRGGDLVKLLVSIPLAPGKFLQIVDVAGQLFVLGVSDSGVRLLTEVQNGMTADRIRLWQSQKGSHQGELFLAARLQRFLLGLLSSPGAKEGEKLQGWRRGARGKQPSLSFEDMLRQDSGHSASGSTEERGGSQGELARLLKEQRARLERMVEEPQPKPEREGEI